MKTPGMFLLGLASGAGLVYALKPDHASEWQAAQRSADATTLALADSHTQLAAAQSERARLARELESAPPAPVTAAAPARPGPEPSADESAAAQKKNFAEMIRKAGKVQMQTQLDGKIAALRDRLQLTADQEAELKALVGSRSEEMLAALDRFMDGRGSPADFGKLVRLQRGELPADVEALLTPAQKADYAAFIAEDRVNRIEMRANAELLGLQATGGLTPEQKDEAFGKLSQLVLSEEAVNFDAMQDDSAVRNFMEEAIGNRVDAMKPILTESQMAIYQQQIEMQRQIMSQFMPPKSQ